MGRVGISYCGNPIVAGEKILAMVDDHMADAMKVRDLFFALLARVPCGKAFVEIHIAYHPKSDLSLLSDVFFKNIAGQMAGYSFFVVTATLTMEGRRTRCFSLYPGSNSSTISWSWRCASSTVPTAWCRCGLKVCPSALIGSTP